MQEVLTRCDWKTICNRSVLQKLPLCWVWYWGSLHTQMHKHATGKESKTGRSVVWSQMLSVLSYAPSRSFHSSCSMLTKKSTIFHVIYHIFRYKTWTGCLEQQQKYNIQFIICHFFRLIIINSIGESSWSWSLWLFSVLGPKWPVSHPGGLQGTNKYTGQDVKKKRKQEIWLFLL